MSDSTEDSPAAGDAPPPRRATGEPGLQAHIRAARTGFESQVGRARAEVVRARAELEERNQRLKQRTGRDLILAILIGLGVGAVVFASLVFVSWPFAVFATLVGVLAVFEFSRALQTSGRRVDIAPQIVVAVALFASAYLVGSWVYWVVVLASVALVVVWRLFAQMIARDGRTYGAVFEDVLLAGFLPLYVPFLASLTLVLLRQPHGPQWVIAFLVVAIAADTGAYIAGLSFGRHPMAPRISPKKTWEGFAGAVVASLGAGVLLALFLVGIPWWAGLVFGAVILATATVGDLGESMIKRDLGIKDMSSWLPGHGGVLDRLDSILPSGAAALAMSYLFLPWVTG